MRKYLTIIVSLFILSSCGNPEISSEYFIERYDRETYTLDLSNQNLEALPVFRKYMTGSWLQDIYRIDLSQNDIQIIPEGSFDIFPNLNTINLASNDFRFGSDINIPKTVKTLSLSDNNLSDITWFSEYAELSRVDLTNNDLEDIDLAELWGFKKLVELRVEGNNISPKLLESINKINNAPRKKIVQ